MFDPEKIWEKLHKERNVIKNAPIHFATACVLVTFLTGALWYAFFEVAVTLQHATIEAYKERQAVFESAVKSTPSGNLQILTYTNDPNMEHLIPPATNLPAFAYDYDSTKAIWTWSIKNQKWQ